MTMHPCSLNTGHTHPRVLVPDPIQDHAQDLDQDLDQDPPGPGPRPGPNPGPNPEHGGTIWLYGGDCLWKPDQWQDMVDIMADDLIAKQPDSIIWNEIVLSIPDQLQDIVPAVFYMVDDDPATVDESTRSKLQKEAQEKAREIGNGIPILEYSKWNSENGKPLFTCPVTTTEKDSEKNNMEVVAEEVLVQEERALFRGGLNY